MVKNLNEDFKKRKKEEKISKMGIKSENKSMNSIHDGEQNESVNLIEKRSKSFVKIKRKKDEKKPNKYGLAKSPSSSSVASRINSYEV